MLSHQAGRDQGALLIDGRDRRKSRPATDENGGRAASSSRQATNGRKRMAGGFTDEGLATFDAALARHTSSGAVPGLVALVARGGQVHVTTAGHAALGDSAPIRRGAIF